MSWLIPIVGGLAFVAVVYFLARGWVGTATAGGADKEAKKRLEEMARREKKASEIKAQPTDVDLAAQLRRMRARLDRHRNRSMPGGE